ncbi:MAG: dienelactone hydrolase family protein [Cyanothece sp. SIO2G6]|nr:dienelactone hydrolase family protein [Cyanothece sp. SIO2G6]
MADITTTAVTLQGDDVAIAAYQAQPVATNPDASVPGIVVLQEIFGVNAHIRDVTERIAKLGYVAIAPALYQRLEPGFETGYDPDSILLGRQYKQQTKADELLTDIQTAIDHLQANPLVNSAAIGCIGFCFGGHVAYLAATLPDIKATASFYGAGITTWCPGDGEPTLSRTPQISGTLYGFFGMTDKSIPVEQVDAIEQALQHHQIEHQIFRYAEAEHGFFCDQRGSYNAIAAADAWTHVQALFQQLT